MDVLRVMVLFVVTKQVYKNVLLIAMLQNCSTIEIKIWSYFINKNQEQPQQ